MSVSDIRNLVPTMEAKGIHGAMIFSRTGFSPLAMKEIKHQLSGGKVILPISFEELEGITRKLDAYWVVCKKIEHLGNILKNDLDQMYF
ncbi:hypothetical protein [Paenibacillus rhizoplanae]|uniref:hypothetical protein n=1 Tax=Paenibacillus rhizoplanae TaxID=1917181 RepID=UPI003619BA55